MCFSRFHYLVKFDQDNEPSLITELWINVHSLTRFKHDIP